VGIGGGGDALLPQHWAEAMSIAADASKGASLATNAGFEIILCTSSFVNYYTNCAAHENPPLGLLTMKSAFVYNGLSIPLYRYTGWLFTIKLFSPTYLSLRKQ